MRRRSHGQGDELARGLLNLAEHFYERARYDQALEALAEGLSHTLILHAVERLEPHFLGRSVDVENSILLLQAQVFELQGKLHKAREAFGQISDIASVDPKSLKAAAYVAFLGKLNSDSGRYGEAERLLSAAVKTLENAIGPNQVNRTLIELDLATVYIAEGKYEEAEGLIKKALEVQEKYLGAIHPYIAQSLTLQASLLRRTGKDSEASAAEARAAQIMEQRGQTNRPR